MNTWNQGMKNNPTLAHGMYNPHLGVHHQHHLMGFKNLCPEWSGSESDVPDGFGVVRLEVGMDSMSAEPWVGSINGEYCTILRGQPSVVPAKFIVHLAETYETTYQQPDLNRGLQAQDRLRWPFSIIVPPKGEEGAHLVRMTYGPGSGLHHEQSHVTRKAEAPAPAKAKAKGGSGYRDENGRYVKSVEV